MLRSRLGKEEGTSEKSDLDLLWENGLSTLSSPQVSRPEKWSDDILTRLSSRPSVSTPKKLYCIPALPASPAAEKSKPVSLEFAYSTVSLSSPRPIELPDKVPMEVFTFKGVADQQAAAWTSFRRVCGSAEFSLVSCVSALFLFDHGRVRATGITGTAHRRLAELSSDLPEIARDKVIEFVDKWAEKEPLFIYSTELFHYALVMPVIVKTCEMRSAAGTVHGATLTGCIFAPVLATIRETNPGCTTRSSVLKC
jgi:hypothetical protein